MGSETHKKKNSNYRLSTRHKAILNAAVKNEDFDSESDAIRTLIDRLETEKGYLKQRIPA